MEHAYAQALWKAVEGTPGRAGMKPAAAVKAIVEVLTREGRGALLPRIARSLARLAEREHARNDMVLTVAREKDERSAKSAAKKNLAALGIDEGDLKTQIDDSLIGGWRLEGKGVLIDHSHKSALLGIYQRATNA